MPSFQQLQLRLFLQRVAILAALCLIAFLVFFFMQSDSFKRWSDKSDELVVKQDRSDTLDDQDFDLFLSRASVEQLIDMTKSFDRSPEFQQGGTVLVQLDLLSKKTRIADRLLEFNEPAAISSGTFTKLEAMRLSERIKFDYGIADPSSLESMNEFSQQFLTADDEEIQKSAHLTSLYSQVLSELLVAKSDDFSFADETLPEFSNVCTKYLNDGHVSDEVLKLLDRIFRKTSPQQRDPFLVSFYDTYSQSDVERLRTNAGHIKDRQVEIEFELARVLSEVSSQQSASVKLVKQQIEAAFQLPDISAEGHERIFQRIRDIARVGEFADAGELLDTLLSKLEQKPELSSLADNANQLKRQLKLVGQKFPSKFLQKTDGSPYVYSNPDAKLRVVGFTPSTAFSATDKLIYSMLLKTARFIRNGKFSCTVVYLDYGDDETAFEQIQGMEDKLDKIDFCRIDATADEAVQLIEDLGIIEPPLFLLINQADEIVAIDVNAFSFESKFFYLLK